MITILVSIAIGVTAGLIFIFVLAFFLLGSEGVKLVYESIFGDCDA